MAGYSGYRQIYSALWNGTTGRQIRKLIESGEHGFELWAVCNYLITNQHTNWLGIYSLPMPYLFYDLGSPSEGASEGLRKALRRLCVLGFCAYHEETEVVWIYEMARFQLGDSLSLKDHRTKAVHRDFLALPKCPFLHDFWEKYGIAYHLPRLSGPSPSEGASEPLGSQEQEQEQEQDLETLTSSEPAFGDSKDPCLSPAEESSEQLPKVCNDSTATNCPHDQIITLYHEQLPSLPQVRVWSEHNRKTLRARWRESAERQNLDWWRNTFFAKVAASDFLTGRAKEWSACLEWLVGPKNFNKVLNGQYDNRAPVAGASSAGTGATVDPMHLLAEWAGDNWLRRIVARGLGELLADKRKGAPRGQEVVYAAGLYEQMLIRKQIALTPEFDAKRVEIGFRRLSSEVSGWPEAKQLLPLIRHREEQKQIENRLSDEEIISWKSRFAGFPASH